MDPGQDKMCGHGADDVGIVLVDGDAGISGPSIGLGGASSTTMHYLAGAMLRAMKALRLPAP